MNIRTTIALLVITFVVTLGYLFWNRSQPTTTSSGSAAQTTSTAQSAKKEESRRVAPQLADQVPIKSVKVQLRDAPPMSFERMAEKNASGGQRWQMIAPVQTAANDRLINDLILAVKGLEYREKLSPGQAGAPSLEQAGLATEPRLQAQLTADDGTVVEFLLGEALLGTPGSYYAQMASDPQHLLVVEHGFDILLTAQPGQYRERNLFAVNPSQVVELEVQQRVGERVDSYRMVRADQGWQITAPFPARANSNKIEQLVSAASRLWARDWVEDQSANLADFGLEQPYLQIRLVSEIPATSSPAILPATSQPASGPTLLRTEQVVMLAERSPLGDNDQVYVRRAGEQQVGTMNRREMEQFVPKMAEWRDLDLVLSQPRLAQRITVVRGSDKLALEQRDGQWYFSGGEQAADRAAVEELLMATDGLQAINFADPAEEAAWEQQPPEAAAIVTLQGTGSPAEEVLQIGDFTEQVEKRLRWVRAASTSVYAKVRADQLQVFFQPADYFQNRQILQFEARQLQKMEFNRLIPAIGQRQEFTLERDAAGVWQMTTPTKLSIEQLKISKLVDALSNWRARIGLGADEVAALNLAQPDITLQLTVAGMLTVTGEQLKEGSTPDEPLTPQEADARHYTIELFEQDQRVVVRLAEQGGVFEVDPVLVEQLQAELVNDKIFNYQPKQVVEVSITDADRTTSLQRDGQRWRYSVDRDIPLDSAKVDTFVSQLNNLVISRFVSYATVASADYGLDQPVRRVVIRLEDGTSQELLISSQAVADGSVQYYAQQISSGRVIIISESTLKNCQIRLERFEPDYPSVAPAASPGSMGN
ncbi:MAG: hypothetical protein HJJLKODD_01742 [Phycisphaerae bacterium]|nr:hypothetical protein [Phycisphaerae bacterium]